jgi:hypothetical protein
MNKRQQASRSSRRDHRVNSGVHRCGEGDKDGEWAPPGGGSKATGARDEGLFHWGQAASGCPARTSRAVGFWLGRATGDVEWAEKGKFQPIYLFPPFFILFCFRFLLQI